MNLCTRPIDLIDAQAVAVGSEPIIASDASEHVGNCPACKSVVEEMSRFSGQIEALSLSHSATGQGPPPDFAARLVRLRAFSGRERRSLAIWAGPSLLSAGVFVSGLVVLALPGLRAGEQASLSMAASLPVISALRALARTGLETLRSLPVGLEALSDALGARQSLGVLSLLLLAPLTLGLRRVLARAPRR